MSDPSRPQSDQAPLNPALKSRKDTAYDTDTSTPPPLSTTRAQPGQGKVWPIVWLVVTILSIVLAIYFLL